MFKQPETSIEVGKAKKKKTAMKVMKVMKTISKKADKTVELPLRLVRRYMPREAYILGNGKYIAKATQKNNANYIEDLEGLMAAIVDKRVATVGCAKAFLANPAEEIE